RREIFEHLQKRECNVTQIAQKMPISRPAVSQHLRVLKEARLVKEKTQGRENIYYLDDRGLIALRKYLNRFWDDALAAYKYKLEKSLKK
ncbi:MAG: metalloregulator ArsR/SmtB family transcription factor, partial [Gammaproteobacteria bacterium]|nr:metalloregulator ArsR/SmtB family transcription factor [Gammaproteobacteria bacterium]